MFGLFPEPNPRIDNHVLRGYTSSSCSLNGVPQPAPAPRFGRSAPATPVAAMHPGADTEAVLAGWGFDADEVARLGDAGVVV